jgi:predicted signal transduction protein with EAL and GGDEF domain
VTHGLRAETARIQGLLSRAASEYDRRASSLQTETTYGSIVAILFLLSTFGFRYRRAASARAAVERLAAEKRHEARTDALTQLPNRRALLADLDEALAAASMRDPLLLALFDLDGFKQYICPAGRLRQGTRSSLPVVRRASRSRCASAARSSGYVPPILTCSEPSAIQPNTVEERSSSSPRALP